MKQSGGIVNCEIGSQRSEVRGLNDMKIESAKDLKVYQKSGSKRIRPQKTPKKVKGQTEIFRLCDLIRETSFSLHQYLRHGHLEKVYPVK